MITAISAALAATPGGFRTGPGVPTTAVGARQVLVLQPSEPTIAQTTVSTHVMVHPRWAVSAAVPVAASWRAGWSDAGVGQLEIGLRHWFSTPRHPMAVGAEVGFPGPGGDVLVWGELARQMVPAGYAQVFYEVSGIPRAPLSVRVAIGWLASDWLQGPYSVGSLPTAELAVVKVFPVAKPLSLVVEGELVADPTPATARALGRVDLRPLSIDLGLQIPLANPFASVQPILQVRWFPGDPERSGSI